MKLNFFLLLLFFWSFSIHGGVGHGNPSSYYNQTYRYQIQYESDDFTLRTTSDDLVELVNKNSSNSFFKVASSATQILTLEQLASNLNLSSCQEGKWGGLNGFMCKNRVVLLVPGTQINDITFSEGENAQQVLKSFQYLVLDRLPVWTQGKFNFEPGYEGSTMLGLLDHDSKIVLLSSKRITVRAVKDLALILEIPFQGYALSCALHIESSQIACSVAGTLRVWNLKDGKEVWSHADNESTESYKDILFLDSTTLIYRNGSYYGPAFEIKIGTSTPVKKFERADYLLNAWNLNQTLYLVVRVNHITQLIDYKTLKVIQTFPEYQLLSPVPHENKIIGQRYLSGGLPVEEIIKFDPLTGKQDWKVYHSAGQAYSGLAIGNDFFTIRDFEGNLHFYDLATGQKRPEFIQTILSYSGISNNSFDFFLGEDKKTFYRKGPADLSMARLEQGSLIKKQITDSSLNILHNVNSRHLLLRNQADDSAVLWDIKQSKPIRKVELNYFQSWKASTSPDLARLYTFDKSIYEYSLQSGALLTEFSAIPGVEEVVALPKGGVIAFSSSYYFYNIDFKNKKSTQLPGLYSSEQISKLQIDSSGRYLTFQTDSSYYVYDLSQLKLLFEGSVFKDGQLCQILNLELRSNGRFLVSSMCGIFLKELSTDRTIKEFNIRYDARISPSEKYYAIKDYQLGNILIFDSSTNKKINELWGHADPKCSYSSVGTYNCKGTEEFVFLNDDTIITTGADQSVRYWKVQ